MSKQYTPLAWYWLVGNKAGLVFSSALPGYITTSDAGYEAWAASGGLTTNILCDGELADVLIRAGASAVAIIAAGATSLGGLTPADTAAVVVAMGLAVTSAATPALNGTYAVDAAAGANIAAVVTGMAAGLGLPGGGSTFTYFDATGAPHTFTASQFGTLAAAIRNYVYALDLYAAGQGSLPAPSASIT